MPTQHRNWRKVPAMPCPAAPDDRHTSPTCTSPSSKSSRPLMQRSNVLLPPPDGPMTAATSPRATDSETPSSTRNGPWLFTSPRTSIMNALSRSRLLELRFHSPRDERQRVTHYKVEQGSYQSEFQHQLRMVVEEFPVHARELDDRDHRADRSVLEQCDEIVGHRRDHD